ncbi:MAG: flavodoxin domain-containing protein [Candidatus Kaelpia imicola]|nr:flavodoxin domain-containing protein [Candidatus Kaelpia imicola]
MAKALVLYYSKTGNTEKMAKLITAELSMSIDCDLKSALDIGVDEFLKYDAIIVGSPTYYGSMAAELKQLFDQSVKFHGQLDGKIGAAFSSAANIAGGNETTVLDIINAMLIHGMIVQGNPKGDHYGAVSIGSPDKRVEDNCIRFASRIVKLINRVSR